MKILLLGILILNSLQGYRQFAGIKNDTAVTASKATPAMYMGIKEIKPPVSCR